MGPFDLMDGGDEIGEWGGANTATAEALTYLMPLPIDLDITAVISFQNYLVFDAVSDSDVFEIDHLWDTVATTAVTDPVHVIASTAFGTEDAALTIVEATHESRLYMPGAAVIAANLITQAEVDARDLLNLAWDITLTTMTEDQWLLVGSEMSYTRKFL
jgi:hypothetical protein